MLKRIFFILSVSLFACDSEPPKENKTDTSTETETGEVDSFCGDTVLDPGEACEPGLETLTCQEYGYDAGVVSCSEDCQILLECEFEPSVFPAVYDGTDTKIGDLLDADFGFENIYTIKSESDGLVFRVSQSLGTVHGPKKEEDYSTSPDCSKSGVVQVPDEWCEQGHPVGSPRELVEMLDGTWGAETGYYWSDVFVDFGDGVCEPLPQLCIALLEPVEFPTSFKLPLTIK